MSSDWTHKYRPKTKEEYVFANEQIRKFVDKCLNEETIPNLMLSGIHGTGKTTLARILVSELGINPMDNLAINSSAESGIDAVRNKITDFCSTFPVDKFKVVILEEGDGLSRSAQMALRYLMEDYHDTVKFIMTCNYPNKIIPEIHSRCQTVHIESLDIDSVNDRIIDILTSELPKDKEFTDEEIEALDCHVNRFYPDMRKIINSLQQSTINNEIHPPVAEQDGSDVEQHWNELWKISADKLNSRREFIQSALEMTQVIDENNFEKFYRVMYENIGKLSLFDPKRDIFHEEALPVIAEHLYRAYTVADQQMNLDACLYRLLILEKE